jgi:hypothetical protein
MSSDAQDAGAAVALNKASQVFNACTEMQPKTVKQWVNAKPYNEWKAVSYLSTQNVSLMRIVASSFSQEKLQRSTCFTREVL